MANKRSKIPWPAILKFGKKLLIVPPVALAVFGFWYLNKNSQQPSKEKTPELARALSVISVPKLDVRPKVVGYGTSRYSRTWRVVSEVSGRIASIHPELKTGAIIKEGEELFKIDQADFDLTIKELETTIKQSEVEKKQLDQTLKNYEATLEKEQEVQEVYEAELQRAKDLLRESAGSQASIDAKKRALFSQELRIQEIENSKSLIQPQLDAIDEAINQAKVKIEQSQRDIGKTSVIAPFTMRVGEVSLDKDQFVSTNEMIFEGYSVGQVEIETQIPAKGVDKLVNREALGDAIQLDQIDMDMVREIFNVDIQIWPTMAGPQKALSGSFLSIREQLDAQTRTIGLVVQVENPVSVGNESNSRPLIQGAYCRVELLGQILKSRVVIPQNAIRNSKVYLLNSEKRLEEQVVEVAFYQDDYAVLKSAEDFAAEGRPDVKPNLSGGETIIISDPSPAIIDMLVDPIEDVEASQLLQSQVEASLSDGNNPDSSDVDAE